MILFFFFVIFFKEWTIINVYKDPANIVSLCLPRLPTPKIDFSPTNILTYPAAILLVQYDNDRLQLLSRLKLLEILEIFGSDDVNAKENITWK